FSGDGADVGAAELGGIDHLAVDHAGATYIADARNNVVREVDADGVITTFAGTGDPGFDGDGGPATSAHLRQPGGVAVDQAGNVYIADTGNCVIRKVTAGTITTIAGVAPSGSTANCGYAGGVVQATAAKLS